MGRITVVLSVAVVLLVACAEQSPTPSVSPTIQTLLYDWRQAGVTCGEPSVGMPDNLPQWECDRRDSGVAVAFEMTADEVGIRDLVAQVPASTDHSIAMSAFADLISSTEPLAAARPAAIIWLEHWDGADAQARFGNTTMRLQANSMWITLAINPDTGHWPPPDPRASSTATIDIEPADASQPTHGACGGPELGSLATFTLGVDTPNPMCGQVLPAQQLRVVNGTGTTVTVKFHGVRYVLPPGAEQTFAPALGTIWEPGDHLLHTSFYAGGGGPEIFLVSP